MRLKFLFFPFILIISIFVFINYIRPTINDIKRINKEKNENSQLLQGIREKRSAIESIGAQITSDNESKNTVSNYLPDKKTEERIIGGINYLAIDSGISLANVSLKDMNIVDRNAERQKAISNNTPENTTTMSFVEATILANGDYEKIKLFIDQLQKIFLFNNIKSVAISNQEKISTNSTSLLANIVINFGYISVAKINNSKIANFNPEFDKDTLSVLKQYVLQKTELVNKNSNRGRTNPFLP